MNVLYYLGVDGLTPLEADQTNEAHTSNKANRAGTAGDVARPEGKPAAWYFVARASTHLNN
jgi:hypothetical protein